MPGQVEPERDNVDFFVSDLHILGHIVAIVSTGGDKGVDVRGAMAQGVPGLGPIGLEQLFEEDVLAL